MLITACPKQAKSPWSLRDLLRNQHSLNLTVIRTASFHHTIMCSLLLIPRTPQHSQKMQVKEGSGNYGDKKIDEGETNF
jgi:hypothetical protein